jgi:hypothetical protein
VTRCPECGFDYEALPSPRIGPAIRDLARRYRQVFSAGRPEQAARRPEPTTWSAQEYACHVRDLLLVQRERVVLAQVQDRPHPAQMSRDERVAICRYDAEAPSIVLDQLAMAADLLALVFEGLEEQGWTRELHYNFPAPELRSVDWVGRHTLHEMTHHLQDVASVLGSVGSEG